MVTMPEHLQITSWSTPHWGGASGISSTAIPNGVVVVFARNENGKSSTASALAWLLAGPGTEADLHAFGPPGSPLQSSLTATIADESLAIGVHTTVPRAARNRQVGETLTADLEGTQLDRDSLRARLGGIDLDILRRYYWVGAEDVHDRASQGVGDGLSTRAVFGGSDPFEQSAGLDDTGNDLIGRSKGRAGAGTARALGDTASTLDQEIRIARGAREAWASAHEHHETSKSDHQLATEGLRECQERIRSLEQATEAIPLWLTLVGATEGSDQIEPPTDCQRQLVTNQISIRQALADLLGLEEGLRNADGDLVRAEEAVGDWIDLADGLDTTEDTVDEIRTAESTIQSRRIDKEEAQVAAAVASGTGSPGATAAKDTHRTGPTISLAALGLAVAAAGTAIVGQPVAATVLGLLTAAAIAVLVGIRPRPSASTLSDPTVDESTELAKAERRYELAFERRDELLTNAGIPIDRIPPRNDRLATRLADISALRTARRKADDQKQAVNSRRDELVGLLPDDVVSGNAERDLNQAIDVTEKFERGAADLETARSELREFLGGRETAEYDLLENHDRAGLQGRLTAERALLPDLEEGMESTEDLANRAGADLARVEQEADFQTPLLEREAVRSAIREKVVAGLAHRLSSHILSEAALDFIGDDHGGLLQIADEIARSIGDGWSEIRFDPRSEQLMVRADVGEHPERRLSTGARSLLNLAFRLATIATESEKMPVLLPVILDDPLVHLDDSRRESAFTALARFGERHQVFYFTCHREHADQAIRAGAHLSEL